MTSRDCKNGNCELCDLYDCGHTCHSLADDPGLPISDSFNDYDDLGAEEENDIEAALTGEDVEEETSD